MESSGRNEVTAAIVGGGPAGLAAALTLSRALQSSIVFDSAVLPRNAASPGVAAIIGRDNTPPEDLRAKAREEILSYGYASFSEQEILELAGTRETGFRLRTANGGEVHAKTVLLACGMLDLMPEIPGLEHFWGRSVINCPFCHGFELRGEPWAVLVNRPALLEVAPIYLTWSDDLLLLLEPDIPLSPQQEEELQAKGIAIERRTIRALKGEGSALTTIELADGTTLSRRCLVVWPHQKQTALVRGLDLPLNDEGAVVADTAFRTSLEGVYAAGDLLYAGHQNVNTAAHMGNMAAATMVLDLALQVP